MSYFDEKKAMEEAFRESKQREVVAAVQQNDRLTTRELGDTFKVSRTTISTWLADKGYEYQNGRWIKK